MENENTLRNLLFQFRQIEDLLIESEGELSEESEKQLQEITNNLTSKVDACHFVTEKLDEQFEHFNDKAKKYSQIAKSFKRTKDNLKNYIKSNMIQNEIKSLEGDEIEFKLIEMKEKIIIENPFLLSGVYKKEVKEYVPDLDLIQIAIDNGLEVDGCKKIKQYQLRTKVRK